MIEIRDLRFAWDRRGPDCIAIDALDVPAGTSVFLHGPSGGGKSTLLGLLAGVLVPRSGRVSLLGTDWSALSGARRDAYRANHVGYIFQQFNLLPYLNAIDNVLLPCRFSAARRTRAATEGGSPAEAARALIGHPEVVIADEPTSALDAALRESFMALLLGQCRTAGSTLVFVSHDERLAAHFDRIVPLAALNRVAACEAAA